MSSVDLVVVEGFKADTHPKIEVYRAANDKPLLFPDDAAIVGIATDQKIDTQLPQANLNDIPAIAAMILKFAASLDEIMASKALES